MYYYLILIIFLFIMCSLKNEGYLNFTELPIKPKERCLSSDACFKL